MSVAEDGVYFPAHALGRHHSWEAQCLTSLLMILQLLQVTSSSGWLVMPSARFQSSHTFKNIKNCSITTERSAAQGWPVEVSPKIPSCLGPALRLSAVVMLNFTVTVPVTRILFSIWWMHDFEKSARLAIFPNEINSFSANVWGNWSGDVTS